MKQRGECADCGRRGTWRARSSRYVCFRCARGRDRHQRKPKPRKAPQHYDERDMLTRKIVHAQMCLVQRATEAGRVAADVLADPLSECFGKIEECHIKHRGMGGTQVPLYRNTWSGCTRHHVQSHRSTVDFDELYNLTGRFSRQAEADRVGDLVDAVTEPRS